MGNSESSSYNNYEYYRDTGLAIFTYFLSDSYLKDTYPREYREISILKEQFLNSRSYKVLRKILDKYIDILKKIKDPYVSLKETISDLKDLKKEFDRKTPERNKSPEILIDPVDDFVIVPSLPKRRIQASTGGRNRTRSVDQRERERNFRETQKMKTYLVETKIKDSFSKKRITKRQYASLTRKLSNLRKTNVKIGDVDYLYDELFTYENKSPVFSPGEIDYLHPFDGPLPDALPSNRYSPLSEGEEDYDLPTPTRYDIKVDEEDVEILNDVFRLLNEEFPEEEFYFSIVETDDIDEFESALEELENILDFLSEEYPERNFDQYYNQNERFLEKYFNDE